MEVRLIHACADGVSPAVLVSPLSGKPQYLVNVPEGFSRLTLEHKIRPSASLACVLLTSIQPHCAGGLGGLILRLAQDGHGQFQLIGPNGCAAYAHSLRHIFRWRHPKIFASECLSGLIIPVFEDDYVVIIPLLKNQPLRCPWCVHCSASQTAGSSSSSSSSTDNDSSSSSTDDGDDDKADEEISSAAKRLKTGEASNSYSGTVSLKQCYERVVQNSSMQQEELPETLEDANPVYIKDHNGSVYAAPKDIQIGSPSVLPGYLFYMKQLKVGMLVVDCTSLDMLDTIQAGFECTAEQSLLHRVTCVVHLSPARVLDTERYLSWMQSLGEEVSHVLVNGIKQRVQYGFRASLETISKLNVVDDKIFPLPACTEAKFEEEEAERNVQSSRLLTRLLFEQGSSGSGGGSGSKVRVCLDHSHCMRQFDPTEAKRKLEQLTPDLHEQLLRRNLKSSSERKGVTMLTPNQVAAAAAKAKLLQQNKRAGISALSFSVRKPSSTSLACPLDFEVVFLGTGSAEPSKYRGSSGVLVTIASSSWLLIDAGEGVSGQIKRRYGNDRFLQILDSLQCMWLSHKHADHVLGAVSVISCRNSTAPSLLVVGSTIIRKWLEEVRDIYQMTGFPLPEFTFLHCEELNRIQKVNCSEGASVVERMQLRSMISVAVDHCYEAYGLVIFGHNGWSLVYSGDTRPCERLVQAGSGCTLLIHEATFEDCLFDHATRKRHSTVSEALEIGKRMHAQHVILTHFSQRYAKVVEMDREKYSNAYLAFDGMVVTNETLHCLKHLQSSIGSVLAENFHHRKAAFYCKDDDNDDFDKLIPVALPSVRAALPTHTRFEDSEDSE